MSDLLIRPIAPHDRPAWEVLYAGYAAFYKVTQTEQMRATVWGWLQDGAHETCGMVAQVDGRLVGLAHYRAFSRPLSATTGGFLDDLFVSPDARGSGAATALITALQDLGRTQGWSVLRWITAENNYGARALYDQMAERTGWITYDLKPY